MRKLLKNKAIYLLLAALLLVQLAACGGKIPAGAIETAVAGTLSVAPALEGEVVPQQVEVTRLVEITRVVKVEITSTLKPETKASATPTPTITPSGALTTTLETATSTPEASPTGVTQSGGRLGLSLNQFINKYNGMTDLQKQDYIPGLPGKTVSWTAQVYNVTTEGLVILENPNSVGTITLKGVPHEIAIKLDRTMLVDFTGTIESFDGTALIQIILVDVKVIRYYVPPTSTPTNDRF